MKAAHGVLGGQRQRHYFNRLHCLLDQPDLHLGEAALHRQGLGAYKGLLEHYSLPIERKEIVKSQALLLRTILFLFVLLCCPPSSAQNLPENPAKGEEIFIAKGCARCHPTKQEKDMIGPDLSRADLGDTQLDLAARIWNHSPSMIKEIGALAISLPVLTAQDFTEISAYLYFLRFADKPGRAAQGEAVFFDKGCGTCHTKSIHGRDGAPGLYSLPGNMSPVFMAKAVWNHSLEMMARMVEVGMKWPKFREWEMADLAAYIKASARGSQELPIVKPGSPKVGQLVFTNRGCTTCHSIYGKEAKEGIDLGKTAEDYYTSPAEIASILWNKGPVILTRMARAQFGNADFTSQEMVDLLSYLYFLHYLNGPGNASNGKRLFTEIGCSNCHGLDEKRGRVTYIDLSRYRGADPTEVVAGIWNHVIQIQKAVAEQHFEWPQIRKGEMADLIEYIRAPTAPAQSSPKGPP